MKRDHRMPASAPIVRDSARRLSRVLFARRILQRGMRLLGALVLLWLIAHLVEWASGRRVIPWSAYVLCGSDTPASLPETVHVGLYEEFPNPWRLAKLQQVDFPVSLAIGAHSRTEFLRRRDYVRREFPQVRTIYFWPLLDYTAGYYPGTWSDADAVQHALTQAQDLPMLWDLEMPRDLAEASPANYARNAVFLPRWLRNRNAPTHIWRTHAEMGLNPLFLRLVGMHFDPHVYPQATLHLDLYTDPGRSSERLSRILRCGVERYGARFIPSFGVLDDNEGTATYFVTPERLRRNVHLAREAGVRELWIFGVNGLNAEYLAALRETLPLEPLSVSGSSQ